ncbi:double zinc ribbon domain-containing protein [Terrisporobacter sp.]
MVEVERSFSEVQVCSNCGEINYDNVNFCQDCGNMLKDFTHVFCEICGAKNPVENKNCSECKNIL